MWDKTMESTVVFLGGSVKKTRALEEMLRKEKWSHVIACDSGLKNADLFSLMPDYLLGDFDSVEQSLKKAYEDQGLHTITFPSRKDDTDGELGLHLAMTLESTKILFVGGLDGRADHTLGNIFLLFQAKEEEKEAAFTDGQSFLRLIRGPETVSLKKDPELPYVSLIPFGQDATGVTLRGFSYPLEEGCLPFGKTLGISNELEEETGRVTVKEGWVLLVRTGDLPKTL